QAYRETCGVLKALLDTTKMRQFLPIPNRRFTGEKHVPDVNYALSLQIPAEVVLGPSAASKESVPGLGPSKDPQELNIICVAQELTALDINISWNEFDTRSNGFLIRGSAERLSALRRMVLDDVWANKQALSGTQQLLMLACVLTRLPGWCVEEEIDLEFTDFEDSKLQSSNVVEGGDAEGDGLESGGPDGGISSAGGWGKRAYEHQSSSMIKTVPDSAQSKASRSRNVRNQRRMIAPKVGNLPKTSITLDHPS
ncbi:hypothetical protein B0A55_11588, partial [Friedmanniomyces simplex]